MEQKASREAKDHVFVDMFNQPKYCLELFNALHPEATDITEDDIQNITVTHVVVDKPYNDLGFTVRDSIANKDRLMILVEAQSTWSYNILIRLLAYLVDTLLRYMKRHDLDIHDSKKLNIPEPEFYVIYTGERKNVPPVISIRNDFYRNPEAKLDLEAKVINTESVDDIIGQYIIFSHVYDQQRKLYGRDIKAVQETIRICKDRGALKEYLEAHEEEVLTIMMSIFDQQDSVVMYGKRMAREAKIMTLNDMVTKGIITIDQAAAGLSMTVDEFKKEVEALTETVSA